MKIVIDIPDSSEEVRILVKYYDFVTNLIYDETKVFNRDDILNKKCFAVDPFMSISPSEEDD